MADAGILDYLQVHGELGDILTDKDGEMLRSNLAQYKKSMEIVEVKDMIFDHLFKINATFNAYRFLKKNNLPSHEKKANRKAAEIFETIKALLKKLHVASVFVGTEYLSGEEIFQGICDKHYPAHKPALFLIQTYKSKNYPHFKRCLETVDPGVIRLA